MTDLQRRILITLGALAAYRLGAHIPLPGISLDFLARLLYIADPLIQYNDEQLSVNVLTGFSVFSLGIIPYVIAAVLMRLASGVSQRLRFVENRSPADRQKIVRATRLLALLIAAIEAVGLATSMESFAASVPDPGLTFRIGAAATMVAGFVVVMWLADQITLRGIGNGIALILFADIASNLPGLLAAFLDHTRAGAFTSGVAVSLLLLSVAVVAGIVFIERAVRPVWVRYPKQKVGDRAFGGLHAGIPLKLNNGGFIPAFIAGWLVTHSYGLVTYFLLGGDGYVIEGWLRWGWPGHPVHLAVSAALIIPMAYFYAVALLDPADFARHL